MILRNLDIYKKKNECKPISNLNDKIFMCWFQGLDHLLREGPKVNQLAWTKWNKLNPEKVVLITDENLNHYAPTTYSVRNIHGHPYCKIADLLRLELLIKYGGTWVDMSVVPMWNIKNIRNRVLSKEKDIFMYQFIPVSLGRTTTNWFITVKKSFHPLLIEWKKRYLEEYKQGPFKKYVRMHEILTEMTFEERFKNMIENMYPLSERDPFKLLKKYDSNLITKNDMMFKRPNQKILKYLE